MTQTRIINSVDLTTGGFIGLANDWADTKGILVGSDPTFQILSTGSSITIDGSEGSNYYLILDDNAVLTNPVNMKIGQKGIIVIKQDSVGSRTISYGSYWKFPGGSAIGGVLSTNSEATDVISYNVIDSVTIITNLVKDYK